MQPSVGLIQWIRYASLCVWDDTDPFQTSVIYISKTAFFQHPFTMHFTERSWFKCWRLISPFRCTKDHTWKDLTVSQANLRATQYLQSWKHSTKNYVKMTEIDNFVKTWGTEDKIKVDIKNSLLNELTHLSLGGPVPSILQSALNCSLNAQTAGTFCHDMDVGQD